MKWINLFFFSLISFFLMPSISFAQIQTFYNDGTYTVPSNISSLEVTLIGGGGGFGGGGYHDAMAYPAFLGKPGGSGDKVTKTISVTPGQNINIYVGKGGAPGNYAYKNTHALGGVGYTSGGSSSYPISWYTTNIGGGGGGSTAITSTSGNVLAMSPGGGGGGATVSFVTGKCYAGSPGGGGGGLTAGGNAIGTHFVGSQLNSTPMPRDSWGRRHWSKYIYNSNLVPEIVGSGGLGGGGRGGQGSPNKSCYTRSTNGGSGGNGAANNGGKYYNQYGGNGSVTIKTASSCGTPGGSIVNHGASKTLYKTSSVPYGSSCQSEVVSCNDGSLSGSSGYSATGCSVAPPANCTAPNGAYIGHGASKTFYKTSSVPYGDSCSTVTNSETLSCNNGVISGSTGTGVYNSSNCIVASPANCTGPDSSTINHATNKTYYQSNIVPFGSSCQSEVVSCNNGSLSGGALGYSFPGCSVTPPANCTGPDGSAVTHGTSKTYYQNDAVHFDQNCGSSSNSKSLSCYNGTLSGAGVTTTYTKGTCVVESNFSLDSTPSTINMNFVSAATTTSSQSTISVYADPVFSGSGNSVTLSIESGLTSGTPYFFNPSSGTSSVITLSASQFVSGAQFWVVGPKTMASTTIRILGQDSGGLYQRRTNVFLNVNTISPGFTEF